MPNINAPAKSLSWIASGLFVLNCFTAFEAHAQGTTPSSADINDGRNFVAERAEVEASWELLGLKWRIWVTEQKKSADSPPPAIPKEKAKKPMGMVELQKLENDMKIPAAERESLARTTVNGYADPAEFTSRDGTLTAVLVATYAHNYIGSDPVYLRSYNGQLVGPTLRAKPGDTLRITVRNDLPTQPWKANSMNTLHDFNTTNLHTHGLHVSPNGVSDNVLIEIGPGATQEYVIEIPKDHTCGTYWYHAHHHGSTAANVASGMSGALIIEGGIDDLPSVKAAKERVMVLNQIPYIYKNTVPDPTKEDKKRTRTFDLPEGLIEEALAGYQFGPNDWATLGRHTTVNGVQLPVIRLRPGQIERWRLIDSGQREEISLQIVTSADTNTSAIPFHEIAVDGIALGKMVKRDQIDLFPGYRSDVLIQAPGKPGEFLLVDQQTKAGMSSQGEPLKYIARIIVDGEPVKMTLPKSEDFANQGLPTLAEAKIDNEQSATYAILKNAAGAVSFNIDGRPFDMDQAKVLYLGNTDEWTVEVRNDPSINTGHPFHIHVNPFEVFSVRGPENPGDPASKQVELLTDGPVWRDTLWVPNNGTVRFRTKYTDFIGTFVQHCHILDHEDQGMMELIDIQKKVPQTAAVKPAHPIPALGSKVPDFQLPDGSGQLHSLEEQAGKRQIVFLFKGHGCLHCAQQVQEFTALYEQFKAKGIQVIGITSDSAEVLKAALAELPCPFPILADPEGRAFAAFGCVRSNGLAHGTFLMDAKGLIQWRTTGSSPYLAVSQLLNGTPPQTTAATETK
jgi:FtsP/CotA-like multicopper oxidase with cupredoxin domain/peroxiredoxin